MAGKRKTYRTKRSVLRAARGSEVYHVTGPPAGWRISRGAKVRGKRGLARKRNIAKRKLKKKKKLKKVKWIKIKMGNPNPEVCGYG